ncbi:hypothetical protein [Zhenhengia yiwuensis]|uniref:hypothetical protein n=1 Tax=Zhenhengia yiwuensis TaxID=2763666 RepID=UPI002A764B61|nr:hypothetical protein [Zhenhengia yiwuensis]MDY3368404.1 hypothetical protein [Zhenhengia yiwuensis]
MKKESIVLGSGKVYITEFTNTIPEDDVIETEANLLGLVQGGASINYSPSFYECKDDLGLVSKKFITQEDAVFKSGVMTWNGKTLEKLCSTARITEDSESKTRTVKIGGAGNYDGKSYIIHFVHKDAVDGDIRVTIVGSNEAGFELAFAKDKETVINAEFKARPQDSEGTLILYKETAVA